MATDNEAAGHLMNNLDWPGAVKDIQACAQYLKEKGCKVCVCVCVCVSVRERKRERERERERERKECVCVSVCV